MAQPWEYLRDFVKAAPTTDDLFVQGCWTQAEQLVSRYVGTAELPAEVYTRAILETGAALYHRRAASNGAAGFTDGSTPVYVANDPMQKVYPLLRQWVGWF